MENGKVYRRISVETRQFTLVDTATQYPEKNKHSYLRKCDGE